MAIARLDILLTAKDMASSVVRKLGDSFKSTSSTAETAKKSFTGFNQTMMNSMNGLMLGMSVAQGQLMGIAFSLMFVQSILDPLMLTFAAFTFGGFLALGALRAADELEKYRLQLRAVMPTQQAANNAFVWAQQAISRLPFPIADVVGGMRELQEAGLSASKHWELISNVALATGNTFEAVSKTISDAGKGQVSGLSKYGIQVLQDQKNLYLRYVDQAGKWHQDVVNKLNPVAIRNAAMTALGRRFGDILDEANLTLANRWQRLVNNMVLQLNQLGQLITPIAAKIIDGLTGVAQFIGGLIQQIKDSEAVRALSEAFTNLSNALAPLMPTLKELVKVLAALPLFVLLGLIRLLTVFVNWVADGFRRWGTVLSWVQQQVKSFIAWAQALWNALLKMRPDELAARFKQFLLNLPETLKQILGGILTFIRDNWEQWYEDIKTAFGLAWGAFVKWLPGFLSTVKLVLAPIIDFVIGLWQIGNQVLAKLWKDVAVPLGAYFLTHPIELAGLAIEIASIAKWGIKGGILAGITMFIFSEVIKDIQQNGFEAAVPLLVVLGGIIVLAAARVMPLWMAAAAGLIALLFKDELKKAASENPEGFYSDVATAMTQGLITGLILKLPIHPLLKGGLILFAMMFTGQFKETLEKAIGEQDLTTISAALGLNIGLAIIGIFGGGPAALIAAAIGIAVTFLVGQLSDGILKGDFQKISMGVGGLLGGAIGFVFGGPIGAILGFVIGEGVGWIIDQIVKFFQDPAATQKVRLALLDIGLFITKTLGGALDGITYLLAMTGQISWQSYESFKRQREQTVLDLERFKVDANQQVNELTGNTFKCFEDTNAKVQQETLEMCLVGSTNFDTLKTNANNAGQSIATTANTTMSQAALEYYQKTGDIKGAVAMMQQSITGDVNSLNKSLASNETEGLTPLQKAYEKKMQRIMEVSDATFAGVKTEATTNLTGTDTEVGKILSSMGLDVNTYKSTVNTAMTTDAKNSLDQYNKLMESASANTKNNLDGMAAAVPNVPNAMQVSLINQGGAILNLFGNLVQGTTFRVIDLFNNMGNRIEWAMADATWDVARYAQTIINWLNHIPSEKTITVTTRNVTQNIVQNSTQGYQLGGIVQPGQVYRVGETGPEWFVSGVPGRVVPGALQPEVEAAGLRPLDGGGNTIIQVSIDRPTVMDARTLNQMAEQVGDVIARKVSQRRKIVGVT